MPNPARNIVDEPARAMTSATEDGARRVESLVDAAGDAIHNSAGTTQTAIHHTSDGARRASAEALSAVAEANRVWVEGAQEMAREWAELVQSGYKRSAERMSQAMSAGSPADLALLQPALAREAMENWLTAATRMGDISMRIAEKAAKAWTGTPVPAGSQTTTTRTFA